MYLIAGLGNYPPKYQMTRHNIGFMAVDNLAQKYNVSFKTENKFKSETAILNIENEKIILAKPQTFMNLSGEAIILLKNFYKIEDSNILIVYDDLSINLGEFRIKKDGSSGGHNGIKSIINCLNSQNIPRLKIGIGPQEANKKSEIFVLENFSLIQQNILNKVVLFSADIIEDYIKIGLEKSQSKYNGINLAEELG